jgi:hypothetical protein
MSAHLASIERQTGRRPVVKQDEEVREEPPEALRYLWTWYGELAARRTNSGMGANPLSFTEVAAWAALTRRDVRPNEVALLLRLDDLQLTVLREAK